MNEDNIVRNSTISDTNAESPKPSFGLPTLVGSIFGVMSAGGLHGGPAAKASLFVLLPLLLLVCGFYAMVIMPKIADTRLSLGQLRSRTMLRFQIRGALYGVLF